MTRNELEEIIRRAVGMIITRDWDLAYHDVGERTVTSHLATYIAQLTPGPLRVDHEYNRHESYPKRIDWADKDLDVTGTTRVNPDILIHGRGHDHTDILALGVDRPHGNPEPLGDLLDGEEPLSLTARHQDARPFR